MSLRIAFMGTPEFAVPSLAALLEAGHDVRAVYCQPPRPAGRGQKERPSPVQRFAEEKGLSIRTPKSLKSDEAQAEFAELGVDAGAVSAYGLILPTGVLDAPRLGCINVHPSLLPRWRGAAPIQRAMLAGDTETGVTIMEVTEGLDSGDILLQETHPISPQANAGDLHDALARLGGDLLVRAIEGRAAGTISQRPQGEEGVTYAKKLERNEERLDWSRPAVELDRLVRALNPWPGVWFEHGDRRVKVLAAEVVEASGVPGTILDDRLTVACGDGALRPTRVQKAGKAPADTDAFLRGYRLEAGSVL